MNLQRKFFQITCVSPVHVGNGETLKSFEYLYERKTGTVYFVDEAKWIAFLHANNLTDDFYAYVQKFSANINRREQFAEKNVWEWLNERGIDYADIRNLAIRQAAAETNTIESKRTLNDIDCHIALPNAQAYIPGSTLKGLFRTAILHAKLKQSPELCRRYWKRISATADSDLRRRNNECLKISRELENEILARLDYSAAERFNRRIPNEIKSVLRGLMVSDAICTETVDAVILQRTDATTKINYRGETEKTLPLFCECIPANTKLRFSVTLDFDMLKVIDITTFDQIFQMTREFFFEVLERLEEVFGQNFPQQFDEARTADSLLGGGVGFLAKSLLYSLAPSHEAARAWAVNYFDKAFTVWNFNARRHEPAHWHETYDQQISPRTLKLKRSQTGASIAGLVQFTESAKC